MRNTVLTKSIATLIIVWTCAFAATAQAPPVGKYLCYTGSDSGMIGRLWIMPKGEYKTTSDGAIGKFVYDVKTNELEWKSGSYVEYNWRGWYAAPDVKDDVRSETDQKRHSILLLDKAKAGSPFDGERTSERYFTRCYYAEEQD